MKIITVEQMRLLEKRADASGVPYAQMRESAGRAVADAIIERWPMQDQSVLLLIGPGNNGGDGLVTARHLHDAGAHVTLYIWRRETGGDSNFALCQDRQIQIAHVENDANLASLRGLVTSAGIIVDALLGTGANRPIDGLLKEILNCVKSQIPRQRPKSQVSNLESIIPNPGIALRSVKSPIIVAVDLPSGVNADTGAVDPATLPADLTVTFACPKVGFFAFPAAEVLGELLVADIGIPASYTDDVRLTVATPEMVRRLLPPRPLSGHKGTFGKAMIVSGGANYTGAPYLSAAAATRVGAGLVTLATTREVQRIVATNLHEATYLPLPSAAGNIAATAGRVVRDALSDYDALLIGPGLGRARSTQRFVYQLLGVSDRRAYAKSASKAQPLPHLVVDADGLNALSEQADWWIALPSQSVLTPHVGEFGRLSKLPGGEIAADRTGVACRFAQQWDQVVLLKGAFTVIAQPEGQVTLLPFANPALATAGSGDVLSGIIVGLLAQGLEPIDAAIAGGYLHGTAGELARRDIGNAGAVAGDLLPRIPCALALIKS